MDLFSNEGNSKNLPKLYSIMPRSQKNDNFIDKTFTIVADILLRIYIFYRDGAI